MIDFFWWLGLGLFWAHSISTDFHGYLRYSTVWKPSGQWSSCLFLSDVPFNFARLGNECLYYGELAPQVKNSDWTLNLRFSFVGLGHHPWENQDNDNREIQLTEIYGTGVISPQINLWVGRRFYRDPDVHVADWFYFGDMVGQGIGLEGHSGDRFQWQVAHLIRTQSLDPQTNPQLHVLDARWLYQVSNGFWRGMITLGVTPTYSFQNQDYPSQKGVSAGVKRRWQTPNIYHELAFLTGVGVLEPLNMWLNLQEITNFDNLSSSHRRLRVVYHGGYQWGLWGLMSFISWEHVDKPSVPRSFQWVGASLRFWRHWSSHLQWIGEFGHIEKWLYKPHHSDNWLNRFTFGIQWSPDWGLWSRPHLRALITHHRKLEESQRFEDTHITYQIEIWF